MAVHIGKRLACMRESRVLPAATGKKREPRRKGVSEGNIHVSGERCVWLRAA